MHINNKFNKLICSLRTETLNLLWFMRRDFNFSQIQYQVWKLENFIAYAVEQNFNLFAQIGSICSFRFWFILMLTEINWSDEFVSTLSIFKAFIISVRDSLEDVFRGNCYNNIKLRTGRTVLASRNIYVYHKLKDPYNPLAITDHS